MTDSPEVNWSDIAGQDPQGTPGTAKGVLPDLPFVVGRLPINADTKIAVVQLPEPYKGVSCAFTVANVSVLSDCYKSAADTCRPGVKNSRPLNDREIEVVLDGSGEGRVTGPGWKETGFPGAQLETRSMPLGVTFVEVMIVAGRLMTCGCDPDKWAGNDWQS